MMATTATPPTGNDVTSIVPKKGSRSRPLFDPPIVKRAIGDSFLKLHPRVMMKNPVMFVVEVGALMTTILAVRDAAAGAAIAGFTFQITLWLWFTVLFANFAEAMAEGRGKAQADTLRKTKTETTARRVRNGSTEIVAATQLRAGDVVLVNLGETIPGDGDVVEGIASVDESAITGESAPVIRESGGDRSAVTGGTRVLSDWIRVKITSNPGETFLDRMIALVEGAERQKTPNEIALNIVIAGLTLVFLLAVVTLYPFAAYSAAVSGLQDGAFYLGSSRCWCLIPTIGGLLSAIGIAGMDRGGTAQRAAGHERQGGGGGGERQHPAAGQDRLSRWAAQAVEFIPVGGVAESELADGAAAELATRTPEGHFHRGAGQAAL